jgi:hypothetical protein
MQDFLFSGIGRRGSNRPPEWETKRRRLEEVARGRPLALLETRMNSRFRGPTRTEATTTSPSWSFRCGEPPTPPAACASHVRGMPSVPGSLQVHPSGGTVSATSRPPPRIAETSRDRRPQAPVRGDLLSRRTWLCRGPFRAPGSPTSGVSHARDDDVPESAMYRPGGRGGLVRGSAAGERPCNELITVAKQTSERCHTHLGTQGRSCEACAVIGHTLRSMESRVRGSGPE